MTKAERARTELIDELIKLKESGDPEAEALINEVERVFQEKIDTFEDLTRGMNRKMRRSLLKNNRFADRFAKTAVKKFKGL